MAATASAQAGAGTQAAAGPGARVGNFDVLRAVAALGVLGIHAYALGGRVVPVKAQFAYDLPLSGLASGVWLFFVISGYVITRPFIDRLVEGRALPDIRAYAVRRALRVFPLYWVALVATILIGGAAGTRAWQLPVHFLLLNNLVPGRQEALFPAAWTLTIEVLFYAAVPLLARAVRGRRGTVSPERLVALVLVSWAASILFTVFSDLQGDGQIGLWLRGSLPAMWQMFCPGILLALAPHLSAHRWPRRVLARLSGGTGLAVIVLTLTAATVLAAAAPLRFGIVAYQLLVDASRPLYAIGYGLLVAAALRAAPWGAGRRWAIQLGIVSYGIYLLHAVVAAWLIDVGLVPDPHDTLTAFVINTLALAAVTIPLALISWRVLERPAIRVGRRLGARGWPSHPRIAAVTGSGMRSFWNQRAREDAFYFVDNRQTYRQSDPDRFWAGAPLIDYMLDGLGVKLAATDVVLEIGCGVGRLTRVLAARARTVIAVDVSDEMLARARELNPGFDNVQWIHGDGVSLAALGDESIDACVSLVVFQHLPDPEIALGYVREVGRVLRTSGWAALQVSNDPALHRPRGGPWLRLQARLGRGPGGQRHPAWLGSAVELAAVREVAREHSLAVEKVWGEGTQYCQLLLRKRPPSGG